MDTYVFSNNSFYLTHENKEYQINGDKFVKLKSPLSKLAISDGITNINLDFENPLALSALCPEIIVHKAENFYLCEIFSISHLAPLLTFKIEECTINVFSNYVKILFENKYFCHYFTYQKDTLLKGDKNKIYIFNKTCLLCFDLKKCTFLHQKCKKYEKKEQKINILCPIFENSSYFVLYQFSENSNDIQIKKYTINSKNESPSQDLIVEFVNLAQNDIACGHLISPEIDYAQVVSYLQNYDRLIKLEQNYFLIGNNCFSPLSFKIKNSIIVDID